MNKTIVSLAAAAALVATLPALAQQTTTEQKPAEAPKTTAPAPAVAIPKGVFYKGQGPTQYLAKDRLIGIVVYTPKGEKIGDVEDLIMGANSNDVQGVIVGVGGILGVGEKKIGVRYGALKGETKDGKKILVLDTSKEVLAALQPYARTEPKKTLAERAAEAAKKANEIAKKAGEAASEMAKKAGDATKNAVDKAKEAAKPKTN